MNRDQGSKNLLFLKGKMKKKKAFTIPDDVENLFSLMDFSHNAKIDETEFLRATTHYRNLAKMLTVDLLDNQRRILINVIGKRV